MGWSALKPPYKNLHITETVLIYIGYLLNAGFLYRFLQVPEGQSLLWVWSLLTGLTPFSTRKLQQKSCQRDHHQDLHCKHGGFLFYFFIVIQLATLPIYKGCQMLQTILQPEKTADISRCHHQLFCKMMSEKTAQNFHSDNASLHRSGQCQPTDWLKICFNLASTNQKHYPDLSSEWNFCSRCSDVISWGNQWWGHQMSTDFTVFLE